MSTIDTAYSLPQASALPAHVLVRDVRAKLGPWGFWGSLGWGAFAGATGVFAVFVLTLVWMLTNGFRVVNSEDVHFATVSGILVLSAPIVVLVIAAKIRNLSLRDYFALDGFSRGNLALGLICLIALIVAFSAIHDAARHRRRLQARRSDLSRGQGRRRVAADVADGRRRCAGDRGTVLPRLPAPRLGAVVARRLRHDRPDVGAVGRAASAVQRARHPVHLRDGIDLRLDAPAQRQHAAADGCCTRSTTSGPRPSSPSRSSG